MRMAPLAEVSDQMASNNHLLVHSWLRIAREDECLWEFKIATGSVVSLKVLCYNPAANMTKLGALVAL